MKGLRRSAGTTVMTQTPSKLAYAAVALSLWFAVVVTVAGCGGGGGSATPTAPTATTPASAPTFVASGDSWDLRVAGFEEGPIVLHTGYGNNLGPRLAALNGALDVSGSSVTAVLATWGGCLNDKTARFTGTRNGTNLTMVSAPVGGVTIRVTGTLSSDMRSFTGTLSADGCAATAPEPITGQRAQIDGVWSDTDITVTITASTVPNDLKGSFAISGTAVFSNSSCAPNATVANGARGRLVFPNIKSGSNLFYLDGEVTSDFKRMRYVCYLGEGSCSDKTFFEGTLTRQ